MQSGSTPTSTMFSRSFEGALEAAMRTGKTVSPTMWLSNFDIYKVIRHFLPNNRLDLGVMPLVEIRSQDARKGRHRPWNTLVHVNENHYARIRLDEDDVVHYFDPLHRANKDTTQKINWLKTAYPGLTVNIEVPTPVEEQHDGWSCGYRVIRKILMDNGVDNAITQAITAEAMSAGVRAAMQDIISASTPVPAGPRIEVLDDEVEPDLPTPATSTLGSASESDSESEASEETARVGASEGPEFGHEPEAVIESEQNFLAEDHFNTIKATFEASGWTVPDHDPAADSVVVTKADATIKIQANKMSTQSGDVETFKAMLAAFKAVNATKQPRVTIEAESLRPLWEAAYQSVYGLDVVPANFVRLISTATAVSEPDSAPSPRLSR